MKVHTFGNGNPETVPNPSRDGLRRAGHTLDRSRYSADLLARVAEGWRHLAQVERQGVISAAQVTADLTSHSAPSPLLAMAARLIQDPVPHLEVRMRAPDPHTTTA